MFATYAEHLPLTIRQVFYRLVAEYGYPKTERAYRSLCESLSRARRAKLIDFSVIRDDGFVSLSSNWHGGVDAFWDQVGESARSYRRDRQSGQRVRIELWCEAAGMAPQLANVASQFSVPVFSASGFASLTAVRQLAERALGRTTPTVVLHVGDLDPSGISIFDSMVQDATAFVEADRLIQTLSIQAVRVALTHEQVDSFALQTAPPKPSDSRSRRWEGMTCQLEALAPRDLADLVRDAIVAHLDLKQLQRQVEAETEDRYELLRRLPAGSRSRASEGASARRLGRRDR